jgi:hypothetical protein
MRAIRLSSKKILFPLILAILAGILISCDDDDEPPTPEVTALNPSSAMPNTLISITGQGFSPVFSDNKVMFNGKEGLVSNASQTQLNVIVPMDAQTGPVSVSINGRTAINQPVFTVIPLPVEIASIMPTSGGYNTVVTINGANFFPTASNNTVTFNGIPGTVEAATATTLTVRVPARAGSGAVVVNGVAAGTPFTYRPDVYIVGHLYDNTGYSRVTYWKNGRPNTISNTGLNTYGNDIALIGDDVYVTGTRYVTTHNVARLWKNGTEIPLTNDATPSYADRIFTAGNDVYIAGYEGSGNFVAKYWKNGTPVNLTDGTSMASVNTIVVNGEDVYASGNSIHANGNTVATYWKNGVAHTISSKVTFAHGLFVVGNDVYTTGSERNTGPGVGFVTYWKNDSPVYLGPGLAGGAGYDIVVVGEDVYVAGVEDNAQIVRVAKYWKNGAPVVLSDGSRPAFAQAIDVIGDDVYVVGHEYNAANRTVVKLWKNGVPTAITDGGYFAGAEGIVLR